MTNANHHHFYARILRVTAYGMAKKRRITLAAKITQHKF